eukprot:1760080-Lingulodinium_polyedra.AAC.1
MVQPSGGIRDALSRSSAAGRRGAASWNARWLGGPSGPLHASKKRVLERMLESETVVMVQETHWNAHTAATWQSGVLAHSSVVQRLARPGPRGGPQSG